MYSEQEKKQWQWRNAVKLLSGYILLIVIIVIINQSDILQEKTITGQENCAIMGDEVITMNECYDFILNGL